MDISVNFRVEKIENGLIVEHKEANRRVYVHYDFEVARQVERMLHDDMVQRMEDRAALEADAKAMQQGEG